MKYILKKIVRPVQRRKYLGMYNTRNNKIVYIADERYKFVCKIQQNMRNRGIVTINFNNHILNICR